MVRARPSISRVTMQPVDLASLRQEIDRIDDRIADLLVERLGVVRAVGRAKGDRQANRLALRLGREAQMLRRLLVRTAGGFPPGGVLRIWREIIANSTQIEMPFACVVDRRGGVPLHDLARDQVGSATPVDDADGGGGVLLRLESGPPMLGILAPPTAADWWPARLRDGLAVVARLPLTEVEARPSGYVVAPLAPEPSGDDRSLFAANESGRLPSGARVLAETGDGRALIELDGFDAEPPDRRWRRLGSYAAPLRLPDAMPAGDQK
jgi:chorismate mutase